MGTSLTIAALLLGLAMPFHLSAAAATQTTVQKPGVKRSISRSVTATPTETNGERLRSTSLGSFTPPLFDTTFSFTAPGRSAATARQQTIENAFNFTPSGRPGNRKALTLGITSRVFAVAQDVSRAAAPVENLVNAPAGYGVDLALGWRGFAVSGGYSRGEFANLTSLARNKREAVDLGLSYRFKGWKTSVQLEAESGALLPLSAVANATQRRYSAELGAAYAVTPRLSLSGSVRYQLTPLAPGLVDPYRADSSVYLGTAFSF